MLLEVGPRLSGIPFKVNLGHTEMYIRRMYAAIAPTEIALANDFGILLRTRHARHGSRGASRVTPDHTRLPRQQQTLVRRRGAATRTHRHRSPQVAMRVPKRTSGIPTRTTPIVRAFEACFTSKTRRSAKAKLAGWESTKPRSVSPSTRGASRRTSGPPGGMIRTRLGWT